jgi:poly(A) polymerase
LALAERLQLPQRQRRWLEALPLLRAGLPRSRPATPATPWDWTAWLEQPGLPPEAIALALAAGIGPRRPLLRWWLHWRHLPAPQTARQLLQAGMAPGPALGERLRELRAQRLDQERC